MWRAFHTAESESDASTASAPRPSDARCWLTSATTCCAYEAFVPGQDESGVHSAVAPSAFDERSAGTAAAKTAAAIAAAKKTRTPGTRRRCAVSESVKAPRFDRSTQALWDSARKEGGSSGISNARCRIENAVTAKARVVRGACPHDCPDTCALLVEVDAAGRATSIKGDPDHPITAGFLCGKVSDYLERVYSDERLLHPLVRTGAKGEARFRRASWDEALDVAAARRAGRDRATWRRSRSSPTATSAPRASCRATSWPTVCSTRSAARRSCARSARAPGVAGTMATNGASPEVDPEEWVHARTIVMWGWNPLSTAPHLWRLILEARRRGARLIAVDPFRSRTARVADVHLRPLPGTDAALALGVMRALLDAGLADEEWCRAHALGYDELVARLAGESVELQAAALRHPGRRPARARARARPGSAVADPPRRRRAAPRRRADRLPHDRLHPGARRLLAAPRRRPRLHPDGDVRRPRRAAACTAAPPRRGPPARSTCRASARR